jgi:hypothetical protein
MERIFTPERESEIKGRWEYGIDYRVEWELIGERYFEWKS